MIWQDEKIQRRFGVFAWTMLAYNIAVILWGAYVRVSFSGDGCGANWPFCNGQVLPQHMATPMAIEFTHRAMTSLDTFGVITLVSWAFLSFGKKHPIRSSAVIALVLLFVEALLGAGLVLLRKVAHDQSMGRVWYLSGHSVNTMVLLAAFTVTAWLATTKTQRFRLGGLRIGLWFLLSVAVFVSVTGVIAALGDTLFPTSSLSVGVRQDFASASSGLLRLRLLHPLVAVLGAAYIIWTASRKAVRTGPRRLRQSGMYCVGLTCFQIVIGIANVGLLAPVWMQLFHLLVADLVWIALVVMVLEIDHADARGPFGPGQDDHSSDERPQNDADRLHEWRHIGA